MRPSLFIHTPHVSSSRLAQRHAHADYLNFRPATLDVLAEMLPGLYSAPWRTCDFTAGGVLMWTDMFSYTYCVKGGTLFIKGLAENDVTLPAFSLPVGDMPLSQSVALVRDHCRANGIEARFSAVPEDALADLERLGPTIVTELDGWADYIYDARSLATLTGKKFNKKRNHVNRFMADNPDFTFCAVDSSNIAEVRRFHDLLQLPAGKPEMARYEREQVSRVLANPEGYPFEGAVLSVPGRGVVAFTFAEVVGDTLHVHIEKMDHEVAGAGETVNQLFAKMMVERHPEIEFINRQDDAGDPGLRRAKESYQPVRLIRKFNVVF